ncbi:hypothetical protein PIB30_111925, partial [Stylosanthes scabra]|nr:hypothetical protein [Stylosanthes scabra]
MRVWIRAQDARIWKVIDEGDQTPTNEDLKKMSSNDKAINFLHCALTHDVSMITSSCETAKEIWDKLNVTYEEDKKHKEYASRENENDSSTSSNKDKDANICLIANKNEVSDSNFSQSELQDAYDKLSEEFVKVSHENSNIKKINADLQQENEDLKFQNQSLEKAKAISNSES